MHLKYWPLFVAAAFFFAVGNLYWRYPDGIVDATRMFMWPYLAARRWFDGVEPDENELYSQCRLSGLLAIVVSIVIFVGAIVASVATIWT